MTWTLNNQNPGAFGSVSLTVNVNSPLPNGTILTNQARISDSNSGIPTTSNVEQTTVNSSHSLTVVKSGPANITAGGQLVYTIAYTVTGNEGAQGLVIDDNTPLNTTFASASGAATIDVPPVGSSGLVRGNLGTRNPGSTGVVTLTVNVLSPQVNGTLINNTVSIRDNNNGVRGYRIDVWGDVSKSLAKREGRSLSQQIGRLIDTGLEREEGRAVLAPGSVPPLAGLFAGGPVPEYGDFREVRSLLSASVLRAG